MPPKRRGAQVKSAPNPAPPKPPPSAKPVPPPILPPPPPPPESDATKVRREWSKFIDAWYEPQKKKLVDKLQKDLLVKYKNLGSAKETQKLREMELFEKLDSIAQQLAQPARAEWERRLELAQLREDQWTDMSGEEQQAVMSVFVGFFADDVEDFDDDDLSEDPSSIEEEESVVEEPPYRGIPAFPPSVPPAPARQLIPPTPTRQTFEFVSPTSFFADTMTPPNPTKNLPALSMVSHPSGVAFPLAHAHIPSRTTLQPLAHLMRDAQLNLSAQTLMACSASRTGLRKPESSHSSLSLRPLNPLSLPHPLRL